MKKSKRVLSAFLAMIIFLCSLPLSLSAYGEIEIQSLEVDDVVLFEKANGSYIDGYYHYDYTPKFTVTLNNGEMFSGDNGVWIGDSYYSISYTDDQSAKTPWGVGKHTVTAELEGHTASINVIIEESPYVSLEVVAVEPLMENKDCHLDDYGNLIYSKPMVSCKAIKSDGTYTIIDTKDSSLSISDDQGTNPWTVGGDNRISISYINVTAEAQVEIIPDLGYDYVEREDGIYITGCRIEAETLEIPSEIDGKPVVGIISLCNKCTYYSSTYHSYSAVNIIIPDSVRVIGDNVFCSKSKTQSIFIGSGVENLNNNMFQFGLPDLKEIKVSEDNPYYTAVDGIVYNKKMDTLVVYPAGKTENTYNVPESITDISILSGNQYNNLSIDFSEASESFVTEDGITYNKDKTKILFCDETKSGEYVMPDTVMEIEPEAFAGCSFLTKVTVSKNVTDIVYAVFIDCNALTDIKLPENLKSIGPQAFGNCSALANIQIPSNVTSIGEKAFYNCTSLIGMAIPNGVTSIEKGTFSGCRSLTSVTLPAGVTSIGEDAFYGCSSLTSINIPDSVTNIGNYAFSQCSSLISINIPDSVTSIGYYAFSSCTGLTRINIPDGVTSIGNGVFYNCRSLTSITIPDSVTSIGDSAFSDCSSLTRINIPEGVTSIGDWAFSGCSSLTNVNFEGDSIKIGEYAFYRCPLEQLNLPQNSIDAGGAGAFAYTEISSLKLPDTVTSIAYKNFLGCYYLSEIELPSGLVRIGDWAFSDCSSLTSITLPGSITSIGYYAFSGCSRLTDVYYSGSEADAAKISIGGYCDDLKNATWHYNYVKTFESISVQTQPNKTSYYIGDSLDTLGLQLKLTYSDGSSEVITEGFTVSGFDSSTEGIKTVTVAYGGKTTEFTVTVNVAPIPDENSAQLIMSSAQSIAGEEVVVTLSVKGNPGISGLAISLKYDESILTLTETKKGTLFSGFDAAKNFVWDESKDVTEDGVLANFSFAISPNAPSGNYDVQIIIRTCANAALEDVNLNVINGKISVKEKPVPVTGFTLDKTTATVETGEETLTLTPIFSPDNATNKNLTWSSNNESVATVKDGVVTLIKKGVVTITATTEDGGYTASCVVTVNCSHRMGNHYPAESSTCIKQGHEAYDVCGECGEIVRGSDAKLPLADHTYVDMVVPSTCKEQGYTKHTCTVCNYVFSDTYTEILKHNLGDWEQTNAPDCTNNGEEVQKCTLCYEIINRKTLDATGHSYGEWTVINEATFHEDGEKNRKCKHCDATETARIPKLSESHIHDFAGKEEIIKPATCTDEGSKKVYCSEAECGEYMVIVISMVDHINGDWEISEPATCSKCGLKERKCVSCGKILETSAVDMIAHSYVETVVPPSLTSQGYTKYKCSVCGYQYIDNCTEISVSKIKGLAGQTVTIDVSIKNNPGFGGMAYDIIYDNTVLELVSYELGIGGNICTDSGKDTYSNKVNLQYAGITNVIEDGVLISLTFKIKDSAQKGDSVISIIPEYGTFFLYENREEIDFSVECLDGGVEVIEYLPGDINGDGKLNNRDAARLLQKLAGWDVDFVEATLDVNGDGKVNNRDAARILQYLAGWDVELF